jgi:hypothetical protein
MPAVNLTVEVHGYQPEWVFAEQNINYLNSSYRIYINDELLIERRWAWNNNIVIQENLLVNLLSFSVNQLSLKPVVVDPTQATFILNNFTVVNQPFIFEQINEHAISFTLQ